MQSSRKLVALLVVVLAILALGPAPAAQASSTQPQVYPPQAHPYGHSYGEWVIRSTRWAWSLPLAEFPAYDHTGAHCAAGQSGPVWYLANNTGGTDIRTCTVPAGKALLITAAGVLAMTVWGNGDTFAALSRTAGGWEDSLTQADVTVDGVHLTNLLTRYRFQTPLFTLWYNASNWMGIPGPGTTKAVADSNSVMLAPLAAGRHTLDLRFSYNSPVSEHGEVIYHLTIRR